MLNQDYHLGVMRPKCLRHIRCDGLNITMAASSLLSLDREVSSLHRDLRAHVSSIHRYKAYLDPLSSTIHVPP